MKNTTLNQIIVKDDIKQIVHSDIPWKQLRSKSILITGATGLIGTYVVLTLFELNRLYQLGIKIYLNSRDRQRIIARFGPIENKYANLIIQDATVPFVIPEKLDYIIHAAALVNNAMPYEKPASVLWENILGVRNILACAKEHGANLLFLSSTVIYGSQGDRGVIVEADDYRLQIPLRTEESYLFSKLVGELLCRDYEKEYGVKTAIARLSYVDGPGERLGDGRCFADFIQCVLDGRTIEVKSDGKNIRSYCYISDAVKALFTILLKGGCDTYHISNERNRTSIKELAMLFAQYLPDCVSPQVKLSCTDERQNVRHGTASHQYSTEKLQRLGWFPNVGLEECIRRTILGFRV